MLKKKMAAYFVHGHKCVIIVIPPPPHHHRLCLGNVTWDILVKNILPMGSANSKFVVYRLKYQEKNAIWEKQIKGPIGRGMWRETGVIIKEEIWLALCCMSTKWQQRCSAITQAARSLKVMASSARDNCLHTCRTNSYCAHPLLPSDKCTDCWGMRSATWK